MSEMNRLYGILIATAAMLCMQGCGIRSMVADMTCREIGTVCLKDGSSIRASITIPRSDDRKVRVRNSEGGMRKIPADQIASINVHREKYPDKVHRLVYMEYEGPTMYSSKKRTRYPACWMVCQHSGDKLDIYALGHFYNIEPDGEMEILSSPGAEISFVALKKGAEKGFKIGYEGATPSWYRESIKEYLSDDAMLCKKIDRKEIMYKDFDKIVQTYNPQWK